MVENYFEQLILSVLNDYSVLYGEPKVKIEYILADDMTSKYAEIYPEHAKKEPDKIASLSGYNGITIPPNDIDGIYSILINSAKFDEYLGSNNMTGLGTIVHETTHAVDFNEYANIARISIVREVLHMEKHRLFHIWAESNARAKGYYFVRKYSVDDMFDESQINYIDEVELPAQERLLFQSYHATNDGGQQAYLVAQSIGRLYALHQIFPLYFTDEKMQELLPEKWRYDWYLFFKEHQDLHSAYKDFSLFRDILNQNFSGF